MRSEDIEQTGKVVFLEKKRIFGSRNQPIFWAISSGKGGVGRSFFTSSLAITLSRQGYRVLMVDADPNGGTLHSWMGSYQRRRTLSDYYRNGDDLSQYVVSLGHEKLCLLPGDTCLWNCESSTVRDGDDLLQDLKRQPFDFVLFDLTVGCEGFNKKILQNADDIFLMTTPEGCSIEKTYRWLESYIFNILLTAEQRRGLCEFQKESGSRTQIGRSTLFELRNFLESLQKESNESSGLFGPIKLLINQVRNFDDERLGESIKSVCNKHYYTNLNYIGSLQYDNAVWQCARQKVPVITHQPFNPLVGQIHGLVKQLVDPPVERAVV